MKFKFSIDAPSKDVVFIFHNGISYMINDKTKTGIVELFGYFDRDYIIRTTWKNAQRYVNLISRGRILKTTML
jgi:hypothetical protein